MRFIIECDDPTDIILGMKAIKLAIPPSHAFCAIYFENGQQWIVRKTKTGFSARHTNPTKGHHQ